MSFSTRSLGVFVAALAAAALPACSRHVSESSVDNSAARYAPGQVWSYETRPGEESSRVTILRVESDPRSGEVIHVALSGVHIKSRAAPSGEVTSVPHLPVSRKSLDASVVSLVSPSGSVPPFQEGYDAWKAAHGGVFAIPLADVVASIESGTR